MKQTGESDLAAPAAGRGVHQLVAEWVRDRPDAPAAREVSTGIVLTYRQLWERAGWLAADLANRGVAGGDIVAVGQDRSAELLVALLGILRAGAAYLPLDSHAPVERISTILAEARTDLVVVSSSHRSGTAGLAGSDWTNLPDGLRLVPVPVRQAGLEPTVQAGGDDPAYVSYTSGSTGVPKGVVVPHRAVLRLAVAPKFCTVSPGDRVAQMSNTAFDATTFEVWNTLTAGGTVVIPPTVTDLPIDEWVDMLAREDITTAFLTTSLFHTVARERPGAFASLSNLVVGGEQLDLAIVRSVLAAQPPGRLVNGYGPTETTTFAAYYDCTDESLAGLDRIPIGFPLQDTTLHVLDDELTPVPVGESGELCVGGPGVSTGYLGRPDLTAERFVTDPATGALLYRTGDLVRQRADGALELVGRRDRQVKLRGFRIELEEIERVAAASELVDAVFVEKVGEGPAAILVGFALPSGSAPVDVGELPATLSVLLAGRLPDYMLPARWLILDQLPLGPTGKADREKLLALLDGPPATDPDHTDHAGHTGHANQGAHADPDATTGGGDWLVKEVLAVWQDVLAVPHASEKDNFFERGGNSMLAIRLATRIKERLSVPVEPAEILFAETLADVIGYVRELVTATR